VGYQTTFEGELTINPPLTSEHEAYLNAFSRTRHMLKYMLDTFFTPWGYKLNGTIQWDGEDSGDQGRLVVTDNVLRVQRAVVTFVDDGEL